MAARMMVRKKGGRWIVPRFSSTPRPPPDSSCRLTAGDGAALPTEGLNAVTVLHGIARHDGGAAEATGHGQQLLKEAVGEQANKGGAVIQLQSLRRGDHTGIAATSMGVEISFESIVKMFAIDVAVNVLGR